MLERHARLLGPGTHLLRAGAGRDGAAAERAEVLPRGLRAAHPRDSAARGDSRCRRSTSTTSRTRSRTGRTCSQACLSLGFDLPYFCWHPALRLGRRLPPVRGQAVQGREGHARPDRHGLHDAGRRRHAHLHRRPGGAWRSARSVIEWLMINHPHDCPVCDEGGECHLQDMTVMTGHDYRRYRFHKRTYRNQDLGPVHQPRDEPLHPVLPLRAVLPRLCRRARPRRLRLRTTTSTSAAHEDGVAGERVQRQPGRGLPDRRLHRQDAQAALHPQVGPADRAVDLRPLRAGLQHHRRRALRHAAADPQPLQPRGQRLLPLRPRPLRLRVRQQRPSASGSRCCGSAREARRRRADAREAAGAMRRATRWTARPRCIGIGSPRASLEANFALRTLVGAENFYAGISAERLRAARAHASNCCSRGRRAAPRCARSSRADAVLVLGEDVTETAPLLALALRQARAATRPTEAAKRCSMPPWHDAARARGGAAREAVRSHRRDRRRQRSTTWPPARVPRGARRPRPAGLRRRPMHRSAMPPPSKDSRRTKRGAGAQTIAEALVEAERPAGGLRRRAWCSRAPSIQAAHAVAPAPCRAGEAGAARAASLPECNSLGVALLGGRSPGGRGRRPCAERRGRHCWSSSKTISTAASDTRARRRRAARGPARGRARSL